MFLGDCSVGDWNECICTGDAISVKVQEEICTVDVHVQDVDVHYKSDTLTFRRIFNQTSCDCEVDARRLLTEMNNRFTSNNFDLDYLREEEIENQMYKLSLITPLSSETADLVTSVGTMFIGKLSQHPGRRITERNNFPKSIYYVLKMVSEQSLETSEAMYYLRGAGKFAYLSSSEISRYIE